MTEAQRPVRTLATCNIDCVNCHEVVYANFTLDRGQRVKPPVNITVTKDSDSETHVMAKVTDTQWKLDTTKLDLSTHEVSFDVETNYIEEMEYPVTANDVCICP